MNNSPSVHQSKIVVGIDPDIKKSGVAVLSGQKLTRLESLKFMDVIAFLEQIGGPDVVYVKLENPSAISTTFSTRAGMSQRAAMSVAQDVGRVKAVCELLHEAIKDAGYQIKLVKPLSGPIKRAKDDREFFNKITGWQGQSNQDKRDAALIAIYG